MRPHQGRDHHGGRNIYPTDIERAAGAAEGVRAGNVVAVRMAAGQGRHRESFAVAVEARGDTDADTVRGIRDDVIRRVVSAVGVRPAEVAVLARGACPRPRPGSSAAPRRRTCSPPVR
nr:hypothetical protein [Pseudonocardia sp. ICBG601]